MDEIYFPKQVSEASLTVPYDYCHNTYLSSFKKRIGNRIYANYRGFQDKSMLDLLSLRDFNNEFILNPGECYNVKLYSIWHQFNMEKPIFSQEYYDYFQSLGVYLCGIRGLALAYESKILLFDDINTENTEYYQKRVITPTSESEVPTTLFRNEYLFIEKFSNGTIDFGKGNPPLWASTFFAYLHQPSYYFLCYFKI